LHTSGSTGAPKPIRLKREQMVASARLTQSALGLQAGMTSLVCLDPDHIAGRMMLVRSLVVGMNMIVIDPVANPFTKLDDRMPIDFTALVPYQVKSILSSPQRAQLNQVKNVLIGGGEVDRDLENQLKGFTSSFYATYGMTETISHIALRRLNGGEDVFTALPGVNLRLDDRDCLTIQAAHLGAHPIVTNDVAELINATKFRWLGRVDFVINTGGVKVIPEKIENSMSELVARLGDNRRFIVYGFPHETLGQQVTLIMEGNPLTSSKEISLLEEVRSVLPRFEMPRRVLYVSRFIETKNGKIDRKSTAALASPPPLSD
jgi:o-succinylbenzoate---CoA ligase